MVLWSFTLTALVARQHSGAPAPPKLQVRSAALQHRPGPYTGILLRLQASNLRSKIDDLLAAMATASSVQNERGFLPLDGLLYMYHVCPVSTRTRLVIPMVAQQLWSIKVVHEGQY